MLKYLTLVSVHLTVLGFLPSVAEKMRLVDRQPLSPVDTDLSHKTDFEANGAGDGIRTRDTLLGRQELFR